MSPPERERTRIAARRLKVQAARTACSRPVARAVAFVTRGVIPSYGLAVDTRSSVIDDRVRARLLWRLYERTEVKLLREHMVSTDVVVDLGASIGVLSCVAARKVPRGGRILAVEANEGLLSLLETNLSRNVAHASATVVHGAIDYESSAGDEVNLTGYSHDSTAAALHADPLGDQVITAPVVHLGELLRLYSIEQYTLLSDIEGAEAGLLMDDPQSLEGCRQAVLELHETTFRGQHLAVEDLIQRLGDIGMRVAARRGNVVWVVRP